MRRTRLNHHSSRQEEASAASAPHRADRSAFAEAMSLQGMIGNAAVGLLLRSSERATDEAPTSVDAFTQSLIGAQVGGGYALPGGVRIHHDRDSDMLTRSLGATGFTQGNDVFLRSDRDPSSAAGQATLAHELTHVAHNSVGAGAVMREPDGSEVKDLDSSQSASGGWAAKIELESGSIAGESKKSGHQGEIDFESVQFGTGRPTTGGTDRSGQEASGMEVLGTKAVDQTTPVFSQALAKGQHVISGRFVLLKADANGSVADALTLEFKDGFVTSQQISGEHEAVGFSFKGK